MCALCAETNGCYIARIVASRRCYGCKCKVGNPIRLSSFPHTSLAGLTLIRVLSEPVCGTNKHALFDLRSRLFQIGEDGRKEKRFFDTYSRYIPRRNVIFSERSIDQSYRAILFVDGTRAGLALFRPVSAFREAKEQNFRHYKNASLSSGNFAVLATMQICVEQVYAVCN